MKRPPSFFHRLRQCLPGAALFGALGCGFVGIDLESDPELLGKPTYTDSTGGGGASGSLPSTPRPPRGLGGALQGDPMNGDAGADAGPTGDIPMDGGAVHIDAGSRLDAGPGVGGPDAGRNDGGPGDTCSPDCGCSPGDSCDLACLAASCAPSCGSDSSCQIDIGNAEGVVIACAEGASCRATDPSGDAVAFVCTGAGNCTAECQGAASCSIDCRGTGRCSLDCGEAETCTLQCSSTSECLLTRQGDQDQVDIECADQVPATVCGEFVLACNAACP